MIRMLLSLVGIAALLVGLLWIGQGTGYVRWPESSFMIGHAAWATRGLDARRRRRRDHPDFAGGWGIRAG